MAQWIKNSPAMQEILVPSQSREDPLEGGMANSSSMLVWKIPQTEEPGRLQSMGMQGVRLSMQVLTQPQGSLYVSTAVSAQELTAGIMKGSLFLSGQLYPGSLHEPLSFFSCLNN